MGTALRRFSAQGHKSPPDPLILASFVALCGETRQTRDDVGLSRRRHSGSAGAATQLDKADYAFEVYDRGEAARSA